MMMANRRTRCSARRSGVSGLRAHPSGRAPLNRGAFGRLEGARHQARVSERLETRPRHDRPLAANLSEPGSKGRVEDQTAPPRDHGEQELFLPREVGAEPTDLYLIL